MLHRNLGGWAISLLVNTARIINRIKDETNRSNISFGVTVKVTDQVKRIGFFAGALICFALGLLSLPLPLPLGIIFNLLGLALLVMSSTTVRSWFHKLRRRNKWVNDRVADVENHLPDDMREALTPDPKTETSTNETSINETTITETAIDAGSDQNQPRA